jgi:hypothetical protein
VLLEQAGQALQAPALVSPLTPALITAIRFSCQQGRPGLLRGHAVRRRQAVAQRQHPGAGGQGRFLRLAAGGEQQQQRKQQDARGRADRA